MHSVEIEKKFNRKLAFSRTIGFITHEELEILKNKTVAIAGLGGVGGSHFLTLVRLGVAGFHIADMDTFSIENFNRQTGANMNTIGRTKVEVLEEMARAINPEIRVQTFPHGVTPDNVDQFLSGIDAYVDSLDFFAFGARRMVFQKCYEKNIPATTVAPLGMGAALMNFMPQKMSFQKYFQWKDSDSDVELAIKLIVGLAPSLTHQSYLVDRSTANFSEKRGPSTPMGIELCAGVLGSEMLKILLNRRGVKSAPHSIVFDAYKNKLFHNYVVFGNRNPVQKIKIAIVKGILNRIAKAKKTEK